MSLNNFLGQVFNMDAFTLVPAIPSESIDAVITDPMNGSLSKKAQYDWGPDPSGGDPEKHWEYHKPIYEEFLRVLKPGGVFAWASSIKYGGEERRGKYEGRNREWFGSHGEWVVTRRGRHVYRETYSQLWVVQSKEQQAIEPPPLLHKLVFYDRLPQPPRGFPRHPCPKPWEEIAVLIKALTKPGQVILDCFAGTGSTLVAAESLGRFWIGCEKSRYYCQLAMRELALEAKRQKWDDQGVGVLEEPVAPPFENCRM